MSDLPVGSIATVYVAKLTRQVIVKIVARTDKLVRVAQYQSNGTRLLVASEWMNPEEMTLIGVWEHEVQRMRKDHPAGSGR